MEVFGKDAVIGDFKLSDYGLMLASFECNGEQDDDLGMEHEVSEEFLGGSPEPKHLAKKYTGKLTPTLVLVKDKCSVTEYQYNDGVFTEHECREILRQLTGFQGYKRMQIQTEIVDEYIYFYVHVKNVTYKKINGKVVGIILDMECDSHFAWSKDFEYSFTAKSGQTLTFYNTSDDLYNYLLPTVTITSANTINNLSIINKTDNNWESKFAKVNAGETITMNSKLSQLNTNKANRIIGNDFNMHFIRLVSGKNEFVVRNNENKPITITFSYRVPRKVGFL